jgi:di/tricarboxylate transporter
MSDSAIALVTLTVVIALFVWNRLPVGVVAVGTALSLWATGLLDLDQAMAGFGDPVVVFIASLFVVSEAIDASGLTTWAGRRVLDVAGDGPRRILVAVMLLSATLTALISLNGSVAALLPMVVMLAMRLRRPPSEFLMPMVFAGSAGSLLMLMGSPVNVIVSEAADDAGEGPFGFFEFAAVGVPILVVTVVVGAVLADRVLPQRRPVSAPPDLSRHAQALARHYELQGGFFRLRVREQSDLVGRSASGLELTPGSELRLIAVQSGGEHPEPVLGNVRMGDVLVVTGPAEQVSDLAVSRGLAVAMTPVAADGDDELVSREAGVVEVVVPPRSPLLGETVFPGMVRAQDLVILAIQRYGSDLGDQPVRLAAGDSMLVYGAWPAVDALVDDQDVLVVDSPDLMRRQSVPLGATAARTAVIVGAMVVLLALGLVPPAVAGLLAVLALVLGRAVTSAAAYRAVSWETVVLVGGLIPLSTAIQSSGAADEISDALLAVVGQGSPLLLVIGLFVLTSVLGLVISNTATALIVLPVALAAAEESGISVRPVLMVVAVAASAALLTPVQTPGNMMIMAPAGYRFGDYWRLGLPLLVVWLAITATVVPIVWPFSP